MTPRRTQAFRNLKDRVCAIWARFVVAGTTKGTKEASYSSATPLVGVTVVKVVSNERLNALSQVQQNMEISSTGAKPSQQNGTNAGKSTLSVQEPPNIPSEIIATLQSIMKIQKTRQSLVQKATTARIGLRNDEAELDKFCTKAGPGPFEPEERRQIGEDLKRLKETLSGSADRSEGLKSRLEILESNLGFERDELEGRLHRFLLQQGLLQNIDEDHPQSADETASERSDEDEQERPAADTSTGTAMFEADPDSGEAGRHEARERLWEARRLLRGVEINFNSLTQKYQDNLEWYKQAVETGECDATRTQFDLDHLVMGQEVTRALIEAEAARSAAAGAAYEMQALDALSEVSSRFPDHPEDHDGLLDEVDQAMANLNGDRIEDWLEMTAENAPISPDDIPPSPALADPNEWDAWDAVSLIAGESILGIAEGRNRVHIQNWNRLRTEDWVEMLQQDFLRPPTPSTDSIEETRVHRLSRSDENVREMKRIKM